MNVIKNETLKPEACWKTRMHYQLLLRSLTVLPAEQKVTVKPIILGGVCTIIIRAFENLTT